VNRFVHGTCIFVIYNDFYIVICSCRFFIKLDRLCAVLWCTLHDDMPQTS